jgi:hypothetical protein
MDRLTYQIFGRGTLIETNTVGFESTKEYILEFMAKKSMAPRSKIIVYYISADGEIVSSILEVEVENESSSFVSTSHIRSSASNVHHFLFINYLVQLKTIHKHFKTWNKCDSNS